MTLLAFGPVFIIILSAFIVERIWRNVTGWKDSGELCPNCSQSKTTFFGYCDMCNARRLANDRGTMPKSINSN